MDINEFNKHYKKIKKLGEGSYGLVEKYYDIK